MQPQNTPPAPPPMTGGQGSSNPYDFLNDPVKQKRPMLPLPSGNSRKQRLIIVGVGALILIIIAAIVFNIVTSSNGGPKDDLLALEQQQTELIRVAEIGLQKANSTDTKALAVTTKFTISSQQGQVKEIAKKAGVKTSEKTLAAGKDTKTDTTLTAAEQSNQFDQVFSTTLKTQLLNYRKSLEKVRIALASKKSQQVLKTYENQIVLLAPSQSAPTNQ